MDLFLNDEKEPLIGRKNRHSFYSYGRKQWIGNPRLTKGQAVITISEFLREMLADFVGAAINQNLSLLFYMILSSPYCPTAYATEGVSAP